MRFNFDADITPYNNAVVSSHVGNLYILNRESYYTSTIPAGGSIHFDMRVTPGGLSGAEPFTSPPTAWSFRNTPPTSMNWFASGIENHAPPIPATSGHLHHVIRLSEPIHPPSPREFIRLRAIATP